MRTVLAPVAPRLVLPLVLALLASGLPSVRAQTTATWTGVTDGTWETSTNWSPAAAPNATNATATFGSSGPTAVSINSNINVDGFNFLAGSQAFTFTVPVAGSSLTFNGAGIVNAGTAIQTFTIGNNVSFNNSATAGNATITNNSILQFNTFATAGNATITNNAILQFEGTATQAVGNATAGTAAITNNGFLEFLDSSTAGTATITNNSFLTFFPGSTADTATITNSGTMDLSNRTAGLGVGSLAGGGAVKLGANALTVGGLNTSTTISGVISDGGDGGGTGGSLIKTGTGTLTLSGANTYPGGTTLNAGTLALGSAGALGSTGPISFGGGALRFSSANTTDYSARFSTAANQAYALDTGGQNVTLASALTSTGGTLAKSGTGTLTLSGTNTYTGGTTISAGTLAMGHASALGTGAATIASGATLDSSTYGFNLTKVSGAGTLTGTGVYAYNSASSASLATILAGTGATLTKSGSGTLTLSGANTYSGGTTISNGTVQFSALNNFGTGDITLDGGTLRWATGTTTDVSSRLAVITANAGTFDTNGNNVTFATALVNTGGFSKNGAGTLTLSGANSTTALSQVNLGTLALAGATSSLTTPGIFIGSYTAASLNLTGGATLTATTNGVSVTQLGATPITIDGTGSTLTTIGYDHIYGALNITGGGRLVSSDYASFGVGGNTTALPINVTGTGSLLDVATQLSLSQTSPGVLTIGSGGTVRVGGELRLDNGVRASTLNLNAGGTLEVGGTDGIKQSFGSNLNFSGGTLKVIGTALTSSVPATLSGTTTVDTNALGATWSGVLSGTGGLSKSGSGTLTLSGANTYTGATAVNAGSLLVTGSLANTAVSVASGATLGGSGTFAGLATLASGGILAPGTSPGTITFNAGLSLDGGSILNFELGTASDLIVVGGGLLSGPSSGTVTLNFSDSGGFGAGTYTLINYATATGTSNFSTGSFSLGSTIGGFNYALGLSGNTLQLTASASAIPEPSTYAAIFGAAALAFAMWRRQNRV